jgi:hypothetical protein
MRHIFPILPTAAAVILAMSFATAPAHARAIACSEPGGPCVANSARNYNSCVDLALRRGETLNGGRRSMDLFIYHCLAGDIPW